MPTEAKNPPIKGWAIWGRPLALLVLILFGPYALVRTPLAWFAISWIVLLLLGLLVWLVALMIGAMAGSAPAVIAWLELRIRLWVARFAPDSESLWLHWARQAHYPEMARQCLDQAVRLGGAEAFFQEGLVYLEGAFGTDGYLAAVERFRKAAALGHAEAAYRLAEALRTRLGSVQAVPSEAETWYQRSASKGFGPAAAWLARAYREGDGVAMDSDKAQRWSGVSEGLQPHPELSRSPLCHDAAPEDPLVRLTSRVGLGLERGADLLIAIPGGRRILVLATLLLVVLGIGTVATFFWAGSSGLFHLPLLFLAPPLLMLGWQAWHHWRERPRHSRDPLLEAAEAGDPEACFQIGLRYRAGSVQMPKDDLGAAIWFRRAAEAGHPGAMAALAEAYLGGHGVVRDPREAARWAELARRESTS